MKKYTLRALLLSIFLSAFVTSTSVFAAEQVTPYCTDYGLSNVSLELSSELASAPSGSTLLIRGVAVNNGAFPILEGSLLVKVYNSDSMVDRFIVPLNISLGAGEHYTFSFPWKTATALASDDYAISASFVSAGKFTFATVALSDAASGGLTSTKIVGKSSSQIYFNKEEIRVDGRVVSSDYFVSAKNPVKLEVPLVSSFPIDTDVVVKWSIYKGSNISESAIVETGIEAITIPAQGNKTISYTAKDATGGEYYAVVEAKYADTKSITLIPFTRDGKTVSIIRFAGIKESGTDTFTLSACITGEFRPPVRTLAVTLFDTKGDVFTKSFNLGTTSTTGFSNTVSIPKIKGGVSMTAKVLDTNGDELDKISVVYGCKDLKTCDTSSALSMNNSVDESTLYTVVTVAALLGLVLVLRRKRNKNISTQ